jgi:hypothetical protein
VNGRGSILRGGTAAAAVAALAFAGCGGDDARQDADVPEATYTVAEPDVSFPRRQELSADAVMTIAVRNTGDEEIPNLAATIEAGRDGTQAAAFGTLNAQKGLASRSRPVWIVDEGLGQTAFANTWAIGPVAPGETGTFRWRVSSTRGGRWRVVWRLAGGLGNRAKVVLEDGEPARGVVDVDVSTLPGQARVDENGDVVRVSGRDFDESTR